MYNGDKKEEGIVYVLTVDDIVLDVRSEQDAAIHEAYMTMRDILRDNKFSTRLLTLHYGRKNFAAMSKCLRTVVGWDYKITRMRLDCTDETYVNEDIREDPKPGDLEGHMTRERRRRHGR